MKNKSLKKITWLKLQLTTAVFTLIVVLISGFFVFSPMSWRQVALALSGDYNKSTGDQLTIDDWNRLDDDFGGAAVGDFVPIDGSAPMTGPLTLSGNTGANHAATRAYVDSNVAVFNVTTGGTMKVVCGRTDPNNTAWFVVSDVDKRIKVVVDTSAANFSSTPYYFVNLAGTDFNNRNIGGQSIRQPSANSFEVAPQYTGSDAFNANVARSWGWHLIWCGYGN